jgi:predicted DNA-binding protein|tara:strand:+ start:111 stop:323 length:213 start_codon:yes stop_codon:yes gene_type:complete
MRMVTCSTRLYEPENEKLLKIKEETGTCISSLIREAVCDYLETKEGIQAKQADDWLFEEYEEPSTEVSSP